MKLHKLPICKSSVYRTLGTYGSPSNLKYVNQAESGKLSFVKDFEKSHIKTNLFQKILLGVGSGVVSITSPSRGDMIAVMGEVTGYKALEYIRSKMMESEEGREILEEKPRVSSTSIDLEKLKTYPDNTLGKAYSNFLEKYGYTPDTRNAVQFVDDIELAYVAQRYRETHDLIHTLLDMPTNMLGEVTVKWVEAIQFKLPMCQTGALFGAMRLGPKLTRAYSTQRVIKLDQNLVEKIANREIVLRKHPGALYLPRVCLPEEFVKPAKSIISASGRSKIFQEARLFRKQLAQRRLPMEKHEREILYEEYYSFYKRQFPPDVEDDPTLKHKLEAKVLAKLKSATNHWSPIHYDKKTCLTYLCAKTPQEYAVVMRVFHEIYQRDKTFVPKTLMDFGCGVGTVMWAAHKLWGDSLKEYYCVDSSSHMIHLASLILRNNDLDNPPQIQNVYFRQFLPATIRMYDIVVSAYTFFELHNLQQRLRVLTTLWNNTNEYLVLIEHGNNHGFRIIVEAREYLLSTSQEAGIECYVFAPCPHELECPRLNAIGKKKPCSFDVIFKELSLHTNDDSGHQKFCFLILKKGKKPPEDERYSRLLRDVGRHRKLAVCDVCTNDGKLEQLNVTASKHGKEVYRIMKRSNWGDLVPGKLVPRQITAGEKKPLLTSSDNPDREELISDSDSESSDSDSESSDSDSESTSNLKTKDDDEVKK